MSIVRLKRSPGATVDLGSNGYENHYTLFGPAFEQESFPHQHSELTLLPGCSRWLPTAEPFANAAPALLATIVNATFKNT